VSHLIPILCIPHCTLCIFSEKIRKTILLSLLCNLFDSRRAACVALTRSDGALPIDYSTAIKPTNKIDPYPTTPSTLNLEAVFPCKEGVTVGCPALSVGWLAGTTVYAVIVLVVPSGPTVVYVVASVLELCVFVSCPLVGGGVVGPPFVGVLVGGVGVGVVGVVGVPGVGVGVGGLSVEVSVGFGVSVGPGGVVGVFGVVVYRAVWLEKVKHYLN
jgi:hypothetical protein